MHCATRIEPAANGACCPKAFRPRVPCSTTIKNGLATGPGYASTTSFVNVSVKHWTETNNRILPLLTAKASRPPKPEAIVVMTREKNIKGRKRHLIVDTFGFVLRVLVHAADISESEGAIWLLNEYADVLTSLDTIRVDQGYKAMFVEWVGQYMS